MSGWKFLQIVPHFSVMRLPVFTVFLHKVLLLTVSMNFLVFRPKATLPRDWQIFKLTILRSQVMKTICGKILFPNHHLTNPSLSEYHFLTSRHMQAISASMRCLQCCKICSPGTFRLFSIFASQKKELLS